MSFSPSSSGLLGRPFATGHRIVILALASTSACLATVLTIYGLPGVLSDRNEREALRLIVDMQNGKSHVAVLVGAYARQHGRADHW